MKVHELIERLKTYPPDARITGFIDPQDSEARLGVLVLWEDPERIHTDFIETPITGNIAGKLPAPPKKAGSR
jgi:hypothetical protein